MNRLFSLIVVALCVLGATAQTPADSTVTAIATIADRINASGVAMIFQPAKLNARLAPKTADAVADAEATEAEKPESTGHVGGYRIQLFSGNNARTAKNQATGRATIIDARFPEYATYVTFDAPYWRLKAGDFRSYEEASAALARLKAALPEFAREMRVVRDRINLRD